MLKTTTFIIVLTASFCVVATQTHRAKNQLRRFLQSTKITEQSSKSFPQTYAKDIGAYQDSKPVPYNETLEAVEMFQWFVGELKGFLSNTHFAFLEFEVVARALNQDLLDIEGWTSHLLPFNRVLLLQHRFARHMYEQMVLSMKLIHELQPPKTAAEGLLINMIEANTQFFRFCDSQGNFENAMDGRMGDILNLWHRVCCWAEEFKNIKSVSGYVARLFQDQFSEAETISSHLWRQALQIWAL